MTKIVLEVNSISNGVKTEKGNLETNKLEYTTSSVGCFSSKLREELCVAIYFCCRNASNSVEKDRKLVYQKKVEE